MLHKNLLLTLCVVVWILFVAQLGLGLYVTYYMPHGQIVSTGSIDCDSPAYCGETYKEDMRSLNIPEWAKIMRQYDVLPLVALFGLACYLTGKARRKNL